MEINEAFVVVPKAVFDRMEQRIIDIEKLVHEVNESTKLKARVIAEAKNGTLTGSAIARLMGWGNSTMYRKVEAGEIPVTKDGSRIRMDIDDFIEYYNRYHLTRQRIA
jgi:excisionase family DNA binding protein